VPAARTDSYFDLATFIEKTRELAKEHGVEVHPEAARFGFAAFVNEGPVQEHIEPVFRQRQIVQYLIESLIKAIPRSIVSVKREPTISQDEREARAAALANGETPAEFEIDEGPDYFTIDPRVSARVPGFIDTSAFRFVFTGQTAALRTFLNQLASFELPVLVREVEVDTASVDEATEQQPGIDEATSAEDGTAQDFAASIVLSVEAPAEPESEPVRPKVAKTRAPRPSSATPIVSKPLSRFTVTVEFVALVPPAAAPPGEPPEESSPALMTTL
jgi:hypothetical protein